MRDFVEKDFPRLLERVYDAALNPNCWQLVLDQVAACCGGAYGIMYHFDRQRNCPTWSLHTNCDAAYMASYAAYFAGINPYPIDVVEKYRAGIVTLATSAISKEAVEATEFYNDWMRPQQIPADHFGAALINDPSQLVILGIAPNGAVHHRNRMRHERQLAMLLPHLQRAFSINGQLDEGLAIQRSFGASLDSIGGPALLLSANGKPLLLNRRAEAELANRESALALDKSGRLTTRGTSVIFETALSLALAQGRPAGPIEVKASSGSAQTVWLVPIVWPAQSSAPMFQGLVSSIERPRVLVLCASSIPAASASPAAIASAFGLSPAEARLTAALASGRSLSEIARDGGFSRNTLRNQLTTVFAKTGTHRQAELVALIGGLVTRNDARASLTCREVQVNRQRTKINTR